MTTPDNNKNIQEETNDSDSDIYLEEDEEEEEEEEEEVHSHSHNTATVNPNHSPPFHGSYHSTNTHSKSRSGGAGMEEGGGADTLLSQFAMSLTSLGMDSTHSHISTSSHQPSANVLSNSLQELFEGVEDTLDNVQDALESSHHSHDEFYNNHNNNTNSDSDMDGADEEMVQQPRMFDFEDIRPTEVQAKVPFDTPKPVWRRSKEDDEDDNGELEPVLQKHKQQQQQQKEHDDDDASSSGSSSGSSSEEQTRKSSKYFVADPAKEQKRLELEQLANKAEMERVAAEQAAEQKRLEVQRLAAEKAEQERLAAEAEKKLLEEETTRLEAEAAEKKRLAAEAAEKERVAKEAVEKNRVAAEAARQERMEQERLASEAAENDRIEQEHLLAQSAEKERLVQARLSTRIAEQMRLEKERLSAELEARAKEEEIRLKQQRQEQKTHTSRSIASTPVRKKFETATAISPSDTVATATSTVASLTPPRSEDEPSKGYTFQSASHSKATPPPSSPPSRAVHSSDPPISEKNEFQQVQLKKTNKNVERYIKETQLEFAEMIANTLKKKHDLTEESSVEALRHINNLKQDLATLPDDDEEGLLAIHKLREELLSIFNKGGALQEEYLLQWILPLYRERDPKTGRLVMSADQVALLQSFSTAEELDMVSGLGMVRSILQSNFKAINGLECLQAINDYAHFRLGKKVKRGPQSPWGILAELFEKANNDESSFDLHQRVRNALVQWVVREILGTTKDEITSRNCMHAIYLIASLKLELQRLAPAALESGTHRQLLEDGFANTSFDDGSITSGKSSSRPPVIEKLLESKMLSSDESPTRSAIQTSGAASKVESAQPSLEQQQTSQASEPVAKYDPEAMREAMIARDNSRKELISTQDKKPKEMDESELPLPVQDGHRVLRSILGPNHPQITVSDCFEAIRIYSSMIMSWKEVCELQEKLLESGSVGSVPTLEEVRLRSLGAQRLERNNINPPPHINVQSSQQVTNRVTKGQQPVQKIEPSRKGNHEETSSEESNRGGAGRAAQLDIAAMMAENPTAKDSIPTAPSPSSTSQRDQASRSQRAAAATQAQAKTRKTLLGRLSRLNVSTKKNRKSKTAKCTTEDVEDPRQPKKRRSLWKKFLGTS